MSSQRTNRALSTTRRWTAGVLLATTVTAGGLSLHLADAYASSQTGTVAATTSGSGTSTTSSGTSTTSSSSGTSSSSFGSSGSISSSSNSASTMTKGS